MTMTGGVVGIVAGVATAHAITAPAAWSTSASLIAVVLAFSVSAVVGLVFGPTEAELRSEMTGRVASVQRFPPRAGTDDRSLRQPTWARKTCKRHHNYMPST